MSRRSQQNRRQTHKKKQKSSWSKEPNKFGRASSRREPRPQTIHAPKVSPDAVKKTQEQIDLWLEQAEELARTPYIPPKSPLDELDEWQKNAVDALLAKENVVVDAPTTAGKTRVVEAFFAVHLNDPGFRACYTCPVKSLTNDKLKEFRQQYGEENVGISTGDIKENLNAPVVVATLESYRNSLLGVEPDLGRRLIVFDEYHYIQEEGRGSAWEEAIILTPQDCQMLFLSASLSNAREFCDWLEKLQARPCRHIEVEGRPVPLADLVYYNGRWLIPDVIPAAAYKGCQKRDLTAIKHQDIARMLVKLDGLKLSPTIVYAGKRLSCELLAQAIMKECEPLQEEQRLKIGESLQKSHEACKALSFIKPPMRAMLQTYGVGFHHSGLAPPARVAVENLVKDGLLRFCTATMGLSLGINFSVRSALISDFTRPGENGITFYGSSEILQMLGRAGRRGKDAVGFSCWPNLEAFVKMGSPQRVEGKSKLKNDTTTFLGLVGRDFDLVAIENFYKKSFKRHQDREIDLTLIHKKRLKKKLQEEPPCSSPAHEFVLAHTDSYLDSMCEGCKFSRSCHDFLEAKCQGSLARLHLHLHVIEALDNEEKLTPFGSLARFFPHAGGLMVADMIVGGKINADNLMQTAQLMAALSLARFKEPGCSPSYRFPWDARAIEKELNQFYPYELFEELYDPPFGRRKYPVLKDFNPKAGYIISEWMQMRDWNDLLKEVTTEYFGPGDVTALIYRTASYLQSMVQTKHGDLYKAADALRAEMLREPLSFTL